MSSLRWQQSFVCSQVDCFIAESWLSTVYFADLLQENSELSWFVLAEFKYSMPQLP